MKNTMSKKSEAAQSSGYKNNSSLLENFLTTAKNIAQFS